MTTVRATEVLVPIDGSALSHRALPTARWLARQLGAIVRLVQVVPDARGARSAERELVHLAAVHGADAVAVLVDDHPADALVAAVGFGDRTICCMATHGRDRSAAAIGSVAATLVGQVNGPVVLVGPAARPPVGEAGPVAVAVAGEPHDAELFDTATAWSATLGVGVVALTVVEPAPAPMRPRRDGGPTLATVEVEVVEDPISVRAGLVPRLRALDPSLVVVGSHRPRPIRRVLHGDRSAQIVHDSPAPVVVVPLGLRGD